MSVLERKEGQLLLLIDWLGCDLLNGNSVASLGTEIIELFDNTLLAVRILAKGVDDPNLAEVNGSSQSGSFGVVRNELDVLNTAALFQ